MSQKSFKQQTISDSTTEVEYIAASEAIKKTVRMKKFIMNLGVIPKIEGPMSLYCDNTGTIMKRKFNAGVKW